MLRIKCNAGTISIMMTTPQGLSRWVDIPHIDVDAVIGVLQVIDHLEQFEVSNGRSVQVDSDLPGQPEK